MKFKQNGGHKNLKIYLIFLIFTSFLWFSLQFTKNYSQEIEFKIQYTKIEEQKIVKPNSDFEIKMTLNGSGIQLLKYVFFNQKIKLDTRKAVSSTKSHSLFAGNRMKDLIKSTLKYDGEISSFSKDTLHVYYDVFTKKEIELKIESDITYKLGYTSLKGPMFKTHTISATGPKSILDTLKYIYTDKLKLKELDKDYLSTVNIDENKLPKNITLSSKTIPLSIKVDKLTEGEFQIPIKILNNIKGANVQLFPKKVGVVFNVALKDYSKLKISDFVVIAKIDTNNLQKTSLLLKLSKIPSLVNNARLLTKEVQYVIIK